MAQVVLRDVNKTYGGLRRRQRCVVHRRARRVRGAGRALGLRQDDDAEPDRGADPAHLGRDLHRRPRGQRPRPQGPGHRHGVPELRALPEQDGVQQPRLPAADAQAAEGGDRPEGARGGAGARHHAPAGAPSARAVRRPAAARRARPRAGARPRGLPDGRAAVQPRRQAARADALGDQALPPQPQRHDRLRHPRPARGGHHGRQDGGDARRRAAAVRHAGQGLRQPGQHLRRELRRQPGHEPDPGRAGVHGRQDGAEGRGRLGAAAVAIATRARPRRRAAARRCSARATRR